MKEFQMSPLMRRGIQEATRLATVLKEIKEGLDIVRSKVQALTAKVKTSNFPTAEGISYLEAKHLLLLSYCQSLVFYLLRKAKGFSIERHPVVRSLVEIRLFLEKIRLIDKKLEYQIQKLTRDAGSARDQVDVSENKSKASEKLEDKLKYRPNPDLLESKIDMLAENGGVYRPPKIAPMIMEEDKMSKHERNALRRQKETLRKAKHGFMKELIDDMEDRPAEVKEYAGLDSWESQRYVEQFEDRARQEEELFTRVPLTKRRKGSIRLTSHCSRLLGLTDGFNDEIKTLALDDDTNEQTSSISNGGSAMGKLKKRKKKRRHSTAFCVLMI
ncbi:leucine zipper factor-related family protein [Salix suchowensis]|nr:leucine zipper factor-related family protein [Salix suchowensis]